ncbi:MAG: hypothetical protein N3G21_03215 [Candidatus Hydrogenedentes bacterium]|nr:hypothetical protein [Candidatus Hydrogenedentota bacterium]
MENVRVSGGAFVGGLVGDNNKGTVEQSYWDVETSGQSTSDGGKGRRTAEMKRSGIYVDWDFESVWEIEEGVSYPRLRAFVKHRVK